MENGVKGRQSFPMSEKNSDMEPESSKDRLPDGQESLRSFDPIYSYVVIERRLGTVGHADFLRVEEALSGFKSKIVDREKTVDRSTGEERLIIKMKHQETEVIMMTILGSGLKKDFHCYVY